MLTGKVAVVTGSSAGIGAAIAKKLSDRGATVINASMAINKSIENLTLDDWDRMVNHDGRGYFLTTQALLPHLNKPSRIVYFSALPLEARHPPDNLCRDQGNA
jgi:NAD(P)-dependent dehydrogenase (short-subunit alcohol dehydrogenase family)